MEDQREDHGDGNGSCQTDKDPAIAREKTEGGTIIMDVNQFQNAWDQFHRTTVQSNIRSNPVFYQLIGDQYQYYDDSIQHPKYPPFCL